MINGIKLNVECVYLLYNVTAATVSIWTIDVLSYPLSSLPSLFIARTVCLLLGVLFTWAIHIICLVDCCDCWWCWCRWCCCLDLSSMVKHLVCVCVCFCCSFPFVSMSVKCDSWALLINEHYKQWVFTRYQIETSTSHRWEMSIL